MTNFSIVADLGGTNIRLGIINDIGANPTHIHELSVGDYTGLIDCVSHYLTLIPEVSIQNLSIAVATPVAGDQINLTNRDWGFSIKP